jgi:GTP-dependent dephospho-CoA kinase
LKDPLGDLWIGAVEENVKRLKSYLAENKPSCFASVGDFVSFNILEAGIHPDLVVVDHKIMRKSVDPIEFDRRFVNVENPPGTVTAQSQRVLSVAARECAQLAIIIDGEEDLLVLPLMVYMPNGSVIVYGQPREGMVVITLDDERRAWAEKFLSEMQEA